MKKGFVLGISVMCSALVAGSFSVGDLGGKSPWSDGYGDYHRPMGSSDRSGRPVGSSRQGDWSLF